MAKLFDTHAHYTDERLRGNTSLLDSLFASDISHILTVATDLTDSDACIALAKNYAVHGKALIVAPDDTCGVNTLTRDPKLLNQLYQKGFADGKQIREFLSGR